MRGIPRLPSVACVTVGSTASIQYTNMMDRLTDTSCQLIPRYAFVMRGKNENCNQNWGNYSVFVFAPWWCYSYFIEFVLQYSISTVTSKHANNNKYSRRYFWKRFFFILQQQYTKRAILTVLCSFSALTLLV